MARMPDFEHEIMQDLRAAEHAVSGWFHHDAPQPEPFITGRPVVQPAGPPFQAPAPQPVTMAPAGAATQEERMTLAQIDDTIKNDITEGISWVKGWAARIEAAAPGIIQTTEALGNSTVGKLAESLLGIVLPPEAETVLVNLVQDFANRYGQPAAAAPAQPVTPDQAAQPVMASAPQPAPAAPAAQ